MSKARISPSRAFQSFSAALLAALLLFVAAFAEEVKGFRIDGDQFTFSDGDFSFKGVLLKPAGKGPFPAILISHGMGGNAQRFGLPKAREFVKRGYVCVAPDYTHSDPRGDRSSFGASDENLKRAVKCLDILKAMPEVDSKRICAYGNSMGAFVTIGLAAREPERLAAAAVTAGGVGSAPGFPAPAVELAAKIKTPFLVMHGTTDTTVPAARSRALVDALKANGIEHDYVLFEGVGHNLHAEKAEEVMNKIDEWFKKRPAAE